MWPLTLRCCAAYYGANQATLLWLASWVTLSKQQGIHPNGEKVKTVQAMKEATTVTELRWFLGIGDLLATFVPNMSKTNKPHHDFLSKQNVQAKKFHLCVWCHRHERGWVSPHLQYVAHTSLSQSAKHTLHNTADHVACNKCMISKYQHHTRHMTHSCCVQLGLDTTEPLHPVGALCITTDAIVSSHTPNQPILAAQTRHSHRILISY